MNRPVALVVEPDALAREQLKQALGRRGYDVIVAATRAHAFDVLDGDSAQVLVWDASGRPGVYRVVWLGDAQRPDFVLEATAAGWRSFDTIGPSLVTSPPHPTSVAPAA